MPFGVGPMEIVVVLVIALLVLGPKRLPDTARSLGRGIREFKGAVTGGGGDEEEAGVLRERPPAPDKAGA